MKVLSYKAVKRLLLLAMMSGQNKIKANYKAYMMPKRSSGMYFSKCYNGSLRLQFRLTPEGRNNNNNKKGRRRGSLGSQFYSAENYNLEKG